MGWRPLQAPRKTGAPAAATTRVSPASSITRNVRMVGAWCMTAGAPLGRPAESCAKAGPRASAAWRRRIQQRRAFSKTAPRKRARGGVLFLQRCHSFSLASSSPRGRPLRAPRGARSSRTPCRGARARTHHVDARRLRVPRLRRAPLIMRRGSCRLVGRGRHLHRRRDRRRRGRCGGRLLLRGGHARLGHKSLTVSTSALCMQRALYVHGHDGATVHMCTCMYTCNAFFLIH